MQGDMSNRSELSDEVVGRAVDNDHYGGAQQVASIKRSHDAAHWEQLAECISVTVKNRRVRLEIPSSVLRALLSTVFSSRPSHYENRHEDMRLGRAR